MKVKINPTADPIFDKKKREIIWKIVKLVLRKKLKETEDMIFFCLIFWGIWKYGGVC